MKASKLGNANLLTEVLHCPEADVNHADREGRTSLMWAALDGHLRVVKILLGKNGIDVNKASTSDGMTPLHTASQKGHVEVVKELLTHLDIEYRGNDEGKTPFQVAKDARQWEVLQVLDILERFHNKKLKQSIQNPGMKSEYLWMCSA